MATSLAAVQATIPAGTPAPAPVSILLFTGPDEVQAVRWRVPPGPRGHLGWRLTVDGAQYLPRLPTEWMVADGEWDTWNLENLPASGRWACQGYNTGTFDHSVFFEFYTSPPGPTGDGGSGNILAGFPLVEVDLATAWTGAPGPTLV